MRHPSDASSGSESDRSDAASEVPDERAVWLASTPRPYFRPSQRPAHPGYRPPPREGRSRPVAVTLVAIAVLLIVLTGAGIFLVAGGGDDLGRMSSTTGGDGRAPRSPAAEPPASTAPDHKAPISGNGLFVIGDDITAGEYRTTVPSDSTLCYWERLSDTGGDFGAIIANGVGTAGERVRVHIDASDKAFSSSGCGQWQSV